MTSLYFILSTAIFIMLVIGGTLTLLFKKQLIINKRTASYFGIEEGKAKPEEKIKKKNSTKHMRLMKRISDKAKAMIEKVMPAARKKGLEDRLREAGYPMDLSASDFTFLRVILGIVLFFAVYMLLSGVTTSISAVFFLAGIISILGIYYPSFYLSSIIKKRRLEIQKKMPDFFDMANLSIEAGMGIDASLLKVCNQQEGPLAEEFLITLEDMKLGKSRREAFVDLRSRVPIPQFQSIITSLIQADMLGVGMAKVLRTLTVRIREQRTQAAREQAMKAPVKMIFPMMLFIFPAIFIVMLGPLVIYLVQSL
ncbi:type II secretion system F family protein [Virgibacillus sp. C22-A2]|uniref:Type II secretion system F family protein n=1 Tax=Virgibacillus tibetensis TaxID=3042313 RepID=A0ABU6KGK6_9BACI|nr:type II secretion system F family protein [Virgibacillus sp. C22-A2]